MYILSPFVNKNKCKPFSGNTKKILDDRYHILDSFSKEQLYKDNNIFGQLKIIPGYDVDKLKINTNFYFKNYAGFKRQCTSYITHLTKSSDYLLTQLRNIKGTFEVNSVNDSLVIITFFVSGVVFILTILKILGIFIVKYLKDDLTRIIFNSFICGGFLCILIVSILCYINVETGILTYQWLIDQNCTDEITMLGLREFQKEVRVVLYFLIIFIIISVLCTIFPLSEYYFDPEIERLEEPKKFLETDPMEENYPHYFNN